MTEKDDYFRERPQYTLFHNGCSEARLAIDCFHEAGIKVEECRTTATTCGTMITDRVNGYDVKQFHILRHFLEHGGWLWYSRIDDIVDAARVPLVRSLWQKLKCKRPTHCRRVEKYRHSGEKGEMLCFDNNNRLVFKGSSAQAPYSAQQVVSTVPMEHDWHHFLSLSIGKLEDLIRQRKPFSRSKPESIASVEGMTYLFPHETAQLLAGETLFRYDYPWSQAYKAVDGILYKVELHF